jgi:hypothetical protein
MQTMMLARRPAIVGRGDGESRGGGGWACVPLDVSRRRVRRRRAKEGNHARWPGPADGPPLELLLHHILQSARDQTVLHLAVVNSCCYQFVQLWADQVR